jgi:biotin carboxyl carrier protein
MSLFYVFPSYLSLNWRQTWPIMSRLVNCGDMAGLGKDLIQHALSVARENGFEEVSIESATGSFKGVLKPKAKSRPKASAASAEQAGPELMDIKSTGVGYIRLSDKITVGSQVEDGTVLCSLIALGLKTDIESDVEGLIREILVDDNVPVQYGQILMRVELSV